MEKEKSVRFVQVGNNFAIDLTAIPGAGFMWEMQPADQVELVSQDIVATSREIGGESTQRFTLVVHQPGVYTLTFVLKRRWEKSPARTAEFSIHAK